MSIRISAEFLGNHIVLGQTQTRRLGICVRQIAFIDRHYDRTAGGLRVRLFRLIY